MPRRTKWTPEMITEAFEIHPDYDCMANLAKELTRRWGWEVTTFAVQNRLAEAFPDHSFKTTIGQRKKAKDRAERAKQAADLMNKMKAEVQEAMAPLAAATQPTRPDYGVYSQAELALKHANPVDAADKGDLSIPVPEGRPLIGHVWPDLHVPHHNKVVMEACTMFAEALVPDFVVDLGDHLDLDPISFHGPSDLREHDVLAEARVGADILMDQGQRLDKAGVKHRVFIAGNHEYRLHRYLCEKAPELYTIVPTIQDLLSLKMSGWQFVAYGGVLRVGTLRIKHGERFNEHVAAGYVRKEGNVVLGHTHRAQVFVVNTRDGYPEMAMTCGTRGNLSHVYQHHSRNDHVHGMGIVMAYPTGAVSMTFVPVIDGKIHWSMPNGKILEVDGSKKTVTEV